MFKIKGLLDFQKNCFNSSVFLYGGGGIRTHGALADTLVFKASLYLVIPIDLIVLDAKKKPFVRHFGKLR